MPILDRIAVASGAVAALFLALIGAIVAAQIASRLIGMQIPAADDFAAWSMAASVFLALPYAMLRGDHIRVPLLLQFLPRPLTVPTSWRPRPWAWRCRPGPRGRRPASSTNRSPTTRWPRACCACRCGFRRSACPSAWPC